MKEDGGNVIKYPTHLAVQELFWVAKSPHIRRRPVHPLILWDPRTTASAPSWSIGLDRITWVLLSSTFRIVYSMWVLSESPSNPPQSMQLMVMPQVALHGLPSRLDEAHLISSQSRSCLRILLYTIGSSLLLSPHWSNTSLMDAASVLPRLFSTKGNSRPFSLLSP